MGFQAGRLPSFWLVCVCGASQAAWSGPRMGSGTGANDAVSRAESHGPGATVLRGLLLDRPIGASLRRHAAPRFFKFLVRKKCIIVHV